MTAPRKPWEGSTQLNLSNAVTAPDITGPSTSYIASSGVLQGAPPPPPRPQTSTEIAPYGMNSYGGGYGMGMGVGGMGMGNYGMSGMGGYGGLGYGGYGGGGYGGFMGGMTPYGGYNRFGGPDLESRFIQMAVENSRPAFDSIGGVVQAVGSVAMMLDNTFIALTSSFRAILGVAENFGRLRSLFGQVWSSFAVLRTLNWIIRKLLVVLGLRTENEFKAWAAAVVETHNAGGDPNQSRKASGWPVLLFIGVLASAPYIILRLMRGVSDTLAEKLSEPNSWTQPLRAVAQFDYKATSPQELSFRAEQVLLIAPQHLQGNLWNSGWLVGTADKQTVGMVPVNYIKIFRPRQTQEDVVNDRPGVVNDGPSVVNDRPSMVNDGPSVVNNSANVVNDKASVVNDRAGVVNDSFSVNNGNRVIKNDQGTSNEQDMNKIYDEL